MATQNPGDAEVRYCPRSYDQPILVLDGRRCIYGWWPPSAVCEACGIGRDETGGGYVGPAIGDAVTYPDQATRFVCRACARASLGLGETDWTGHQCRSECNDTLHIDSVALQRGDLESASPQERLARFAGDYSARGWTVTDVDLDRDAPVVTGRFWAITFEPTVPRW